MSEPHETEPDDGSQGPLLLSRIRPVAVVAFGALVVWMILTWAYGGLAIAWEIWQRMQGR
jgi:hypothetical protein